MTERVQRVDEPVGAHGGGAGEAQLDDLGGGEDLPESTVDLIVDGVMIGGQQIQELDGQSLLGGEVRMARGEQAGHVLVGDGVVLAGLHARLALTQLGAPDPDQLKDPPSEQAFLAPGGTGHTGLDDLGGAIGEDLQGDGGGVGPVGHTLLDDASRLLGQLVHRNWFDAWHTLPLSIGVTDRSSSVITNLSATNL